MPGISFDHLHIKSADPDAAARFYVDVLGAQEVSRANRRGRFRVTVTLGGVSIFIQDRDPESAAQPVSPYQGLEHFGLLVSDLDAEASRMRALGVRFKVEPRESSPGIKVAFLEGPDGELIELIERNPA